MEGCGIIPVGPGCCFRGGTLKNVDIALLMGGHASEHAISMQTGRVLLAAALEGGYGVWPVLIARDGIWNLLDRVSPGMAAPELPYVVGSSLGGSHLSGDPLLVTAALTRVGVDAALLGLHGRAGEDGSVQGFLETAGLLYTGCGVTASAIAIDKLHFKRLMVAQGLPTPAFREITRRDLDADDGLGRAVDDAIEDLSLPVAVKAPALGSSVSVFLARNADEVRQSVSSVLEVSRRCLVEAWVDGRELTCAVLGGGGGPEVLPLIEIKPRKASWFDHASKYEPEGANEIVPAEIPDELAARVSDIGLQVHRLLDARGVTRTDFMVDGDGSPQVLETNTLPGMTEASLVPKAAKAAGITLPALVDRLIVEVLNEGMGPPSPQATT